MLQGPVELSGAGAGQDAPGLRPEDRLCSLLEPAEPATLEAWFAALADGGSDVDLLRLRPWGDHDGQVTDRFGVPWLIGYEGWHRPVPATSLGRTAVAPPASRASGRTQKPTSADWTDRALRPGHCIPNWAMALRKPTTTAGVGSP